MKKTLVIISTLFIFFFTLVVKPNVVMAESTNDEVLVSEETVYEDDGSYTVTVIYQTVINKNTRTNVYQTSGKKLVTKYSAVNTVLWEYTLHAGFTVYEGDYAAGISAFYYTDINSSSWKFSDGNATYQSNYARGVGVFKFSPLSVTLQTVNIDIYMYCDEYGNIS